MISHFPEDVPTWDNGTWTKTRFETREEYRDFLVPLFKEPGKYEYNADSAKIFRDQAVLFEQNGYYCKYPDGTRDFRRYWDDQKAKCRFGLIIKSGEHTWYMTRDYYMWLNFLPIFNKETKRFQFADIRDAQYHIALYETLAELHYNHASILKKRQIASSYFHAGKMINQLWFEEGVTLKMGASLKDYINEKGTWKFLNEYEAFLNEHTAWYRPLNPDRALHWQQKIEVTKGPNKRKTEVGLKGVLQGMSFEKDPTNGVGGPCTIFFHEEAGIAPKMDDTYEYMQPALKSGLITTGIFIAAGSVGDLDQCEPLRDMTLNPEANSIYPVESNLLDEKNTFGKSGLFIPEQWSMPPYIDEFGNSKVEEALEALDKQFAEWKKQLQPATYQLRISQHPRNIQEAFAYRKESVFPLDLVNAQIRRIEEKEYPMEYLDIFRGEDGKPKVKQSNKQPISEFPISKRTVDKTGCLVVYERPRKNIDFGTYYASIDPVSEGKTTTSESLCSIIVYRPNIEVTKIKDEEIESYTERDAIVATWCGRYDNLTKTHEMLELIIEWYNAWTVVENNISLFIQYMISRKKQKYLVPKTQMLFLKEIGSNKNVYQEYGWRNTGTLFRAHMLSYGIEYLQEELDHVTKPDGEIVKTIYGVERIPDIMLLKEMQAYHHGLNVDRLVTYCALIAFAKVQEANRGYRKLVEKSDQAKGLQQKNNFSILNKSPFRHMGGSSAFPNMKRSKRAFRNLK